MSGEIELAAATAELNRTLRKDVVPLFKEILEALRENTEALYWQKGGGAPFDHRPH